MLKFITDFLFGRETTTYPKITDTNGRAYALLLDLKAGDYVEVDDAIAETTNLKMNVLYFVHMNDFGELFILEQDDYGNDICNFYLDAQYAVCPNTDTKYYIGIYKV